MAIIFATTESLGFYSITGGATMVTTAGTFDANYSRAAMRTDVNSRVAKARFDSSSTHIYVTFRLRIEDANLSTNDLTVFQLQHGDTPVFRIRPQDGSWRCFSFDGGGEANQQIFSPNLQPNGIQKFTIRFNLNTSGGFDVWVDEDLVASFTGDTITGSGATTIDELRCSGARTGSSITGWSEIIVSTFPQNLRNMRLATLFVDGEGNQTQWVGGFGDIDDINRTDADNITSDTADEVEMMNVAAYNGDVTFDVETIVMHASVQKGSTGPQNFQFGVRSGTTDGFSANKTILETYTVVRHNFDTNPDTSNPWTAAELAAMQAGVKSIA